MLIHVPLTHIDDNPFQRRQDYGDVKSLAVDIQARGLLQTPRGRLLFDGKPQDSLQTARTLEPLGPGWPAAQSFRVQIAFGHRRLRAFRHLAEAHGGRWAAMPVYIEALDDDAMLNAVWSENQHRSDINPIEQAELLQQKLERVRAAGGNQTTLAAEWGLDRSTIANKLRLLDLPEHVRAAVRTRDLSERQATALLPVLDLEAKLNGAKVDWAERAGTWRPAAPSVYVAHVVANPDTPSDKIREYVQEAARLAGQRVGAAFATFDAGDGPNIIQSTCKGCPRRYNELCLNTRCFDARAARYRAALPEWASRETGLPYSDNQADFTGLTSALENVLADFRAGNHDGLVVGVSLGYLATRPYGQAYCNDEALLDDWRAGVLIGRAADAAPAVPEIRPTPDELKRWQKDRTRADKDRLARVRRDLRARMDAFVQDSVALRVFFALYDLRGAEEAAAKHTEPTVDAYTDRLFDIAWQRREQYHRDGDNRADLRRHLQAAGVNPDLVDPAEPALRLLDIARDALLYVEDRREHVSREGERLTRARQALAELNAAPALVFASDELQAIARYLTAAAERDEKLYQEAPGA